MQYGDDAIERYKQQMMDYAKKGGHQINQRPAAVPAAAPVAESAPVVEDAAEANADEPETRDAQEVRGDELAPPGEGAVGEIPQLQIPYPQSGPQYVDKTPNPEAVMPPIVSYQSFLQNNPYEGFLKIQVFAAQQALPISNATVTIKKEMTDGDHVFFQGLTDADGIVDNLSLPAPDRELSEQPTQYLPYAGYQVHVTHPRFNPVEILLTPVFAGVRSIQPVELTPRLVDTMGAGQAY